MKALNIALKDLKRTAKSPFSLIMMFGAPLLIAGLLYFAFGGMVSGDEFNMPATRLIVANLDEPSEGHFAAGQMLVDFLHDEELGDVLTISEAATETDARAAVEERQADVAVIIPPSFTASAFTPDQTLSVTLYQDPTLTIGPGIVKDLLKHFMDGFAGSKIAVQVAASQFNAQGVMPSDDLTASVSQQYSAWLESPGHHDESVETPDVIITPPAGQATTADTQTQMVDSIMAGMIIFFVFFMGASTAESIIREDEEGTLPRLFTTPTGYNTILAGKLLSVIATLLVQTLVLLAVSGLLFGIRWGQPLVIALTVFGLLVAAAGFGVMLMSFIKTTRQAGPIMGGVMAITGMLGGLFTSAMPNMPEAFDTATLVTPHGWAMRAWSLMLNGAGVTDILVPVLALLGLGAVFFTVGTLLFRRRFQ